jgi:hypothetical protein
MRKIRPLFLALTLILSYYNGEAQETVFTLLQNDLKLADKYFENRNYHQALNLYLAIAKKNPSQEIQLQIARSYHCLKQYSKAVAAYDKVQKDNKLLPLEDAYNYAEAQSGNFDYEKAVKSYQDYLKRVPNDQLIIKKIWRLNNIKFLYEDSTHFAVRPISINTEYGELCPAFYKDGVVFMSNRKSVQVVNKMDGALQTPFYRIYLSKISPDTTSNDGIPGYHVPVIFSKEFNARFHSGPFAFYGRQKKMVFTATGNEMGKQGTRTLQLFFAEETDGAWKINHAFPFNSATYSVSDPTITQDGRVMYFSSDMTGGFGGKDLYKSELVNGQWTKPANLGDIINTPEDEVFPYLHNHTLYFSSNGHAGLGGLDIFKADLSGTDFDEPENAGYPINTNFDEFGIIVDSLNTHGYFSSNRKSGGYNDDLYEFDMDLQTYPIEIKGLIKHKEHNWSDSSHLQALPHARLYLIDNIRNVVVHECSSDGDGNFSIIIPYFSKYKIRVISADNDENIVSLEIPKHRKSYSQYEIVVVKDAFKSGENQVIK